MLLGILVLAGWFSHLSALNRVALGSSPMVANAAVAFLLDGLALVLIARRRPRAAWIGAAISLLAGILTLVEYGLSCDLGFDRWLIAVTLSGAAAPGRLAPNTAVAFVFCGLALSCAARRSFFRGRQALVGVLGSIVLAMGTASVFGSIGGPRGYRCPRARRRDLPAPAHRADTGKGSAGRPPPPKTTGTARPD